jgi:hypothetical protein
MEELLGERTAPLWDMAARRHSRSLRKERMRRGNAGDKIVD